MLTRFDIDTRELGEGPAKTRMRDMTVEKELANGDVAEAWNIRTGVIKTGPGLFIACQWVGTRRRGMRRQYHWQY